MAKVFKGVSTGSGWTDITQAEYIPATGKEGVFTVQLSNTTTSPIKVKVAVGAQNYVIKSVTLGKEFEEASSLYLKPRAIDAGETIHIFTEAAGIAMRVTVNEQKKA